MLSRIVPVLTGAIKVARTGSCVTSPTPQGWDSFGWYSHSRGGPLESDAACPACRCTERWRAPHMAPALHAHATNVPYSTSLRPQEVCVHKIVIIRLTLCNRWQRRGASSTLRHFRQATCENGKSPTELLWHALCEESVSAAESRHRKNAELELAIIAPAGTRAQLDIDTRHPHWQAGRQAGGAVADPWNVHMTHFAHSKRRS